MKVYPLMTVWLISCVITYSGLTEANRYSSFKHEKKNHDAYELARLYGRGDSIASYRLNALRLLAAEKKKKSKTTTEADSCVVSSSRSSTTAKHKKGAKTTTVESQGISNSDDLCSQSSVSTVSSTSTGKNKKGTKKSKTQSTTSSQGGDGSENNLINASGGNKWKKIQKFFFGPPNWSFNKTYRIYNSRATTTDTKDKDELKQIQFSQNPTDGHYYQSTVRDSTFLHPIPNITNDQYKDKLYVKEEIIKKNTPGSDNYHLKQQMSDVDTPNNTSRQQQNEIEKMSSPKANEGEVVIKESINPEGKSVSTNLQLGDDKVSSLGITEKINEITPSMQIDQQEGILYRPWYLKQELSTTREELVESDKPSSFRSSGEEKLLTQNPFVESEKELTYPHKNGHTYDVVHHNEYIPSNDQIEPIENINYIEKGTLFTDLIETANTIGINEDIDERKLQLTPEEITDNIKENNEVSMVREDSKILFKPEATIELERPPNQTSIENPDLSYKDNYGMTADKLKHIFNFKDPDNEQLKSLYNNIIQHPVTDNDFITSKIGSALDKIIKLNFNNLYNIDYGRNLTDSSNMFLKVFGNILSKEIPEIFPQHIAEQLYKTSLLPGYDLDKDNAYDQKANQPFFVNLETQLPTDKMKDNFTHVQVDEEKYIPLTVETTLIVKPAYDNAYGVDLKLLAKEETQQQKIEENTSTTPTSTIMQQYSIDMWPKYTEKSDYNADYYNNVITQTTAQPLSSSQLLEVYTSLNHINSTRGTENNSIGESRIKESTVTTKGAGAFETLVTIPLIFTDKGSEIKNPHPVTSLNITKQMDYQSILNLTLNPLLFSDLWGYLNYSSTKPISTTLTLFHDDNIPFENQHEFNADHHSQSTLQPFLSNTATSEWAPFNIPVLRNELDVGSQSNDEVTHGNIKTMTNLPNIYGRLSMDKEMERNFTLMPKYIPFAGEMERRPSFLMDQPLVKPESVKKIHKFINHQKELLNDPNWSEIMYQTRLGKQRMGYPNEDFRQSKKLLDENKVYQNFRIPSFFEEKIGDDTLIHFPPVFKGSITNKGKSDMGESMVEPFLRNLKNIEVMAPKSDGRNYDKNEVIKNVIEKMTTQEVNNDRKMKTKLNFWNNFNEPSKFETQEVKEITSKYEQTNAVAFDEFHRIATNRSLVEFQRKNFSKATENEVNSLSIHDNKIWTEQPIPILQNENKAVASSNGWYVHNEMNENILASEKNLERKFSSARPVSLQKDINMDPLRNNIDFFNNMMNQSFPELTNNSDLNKNEFSAIQMSAIKIFKKKPDMSVPPLYDPFNNFLHQNNNTGINIEMSQMFTKMQDFVNKLGIKKILLKRDVTDSQNTTQISYCSWRNRCSTLPSYKTPAYPLNSNIKIYPSTFNRDKKYCDIINNIESSQINNKWKYNIQSVIDEKNSDLNSLKNSIHKDNGLSSQLEKFSSNAINQNLMNSDYNCINKNKEFFRNNVNSGMKRNVLGNKKMKSRELEFILDRNLPMLPLNKRQFIAYMMTGLKNSDHVAVDEERHSHLSKANLQNLIDRNVKKEKWIETSNKTPKKKHWRNHNFPGK